MPIPKTDGLTRRHVELALADLNAGISHPFGTPTRYEVVHHGKRYPPKAVVGLAVKHLRGRMLRPNQFSGGEGASGANQLLRDLGFEVVLKEDQAGQGGFITSRGVDLPSDTKTMAGYIWFNLWKRQLWPYRELNEGDILYWYDSSKKALVWKSRIKEIVRFQYPNKNEVKRRLKATFGAVDFSGDYFRDASESGYCLAYKVDSVSRLNLPKPSEFPFPRAGWLRCDDSETNRWLSGAERIESHDGSAAKELSEVASQAEKTGSFSPTSLEDERKRTLRAIVSRRGQSDFRATLVGVYGGRCAVSGCDALAALEAAHIVPYRGSVTNHVQNGILLRADIHTLFDLDLIGIEPETLKIRLAPALEGSTYAEFDGREVARTSSVKSAPSKEALEQRWRQFQKAAGK